MALHKKLTTGILPEFVIWHSKFLKLVQELATKIAQKIILKPKLHGITKKIGRCESSYVTSPLCLLPAFSKIRLHSCSIFFS